MTTPRSALKLDLFAQASRQHKRDALGDPLQVIARHIDFAELARLVDALIERGDGRKGGRPAAPPMGRILVLKCLYNLSHEQMEYQLLDRASYRRKFVRTIGQARATVAMTMMAACYNMKRLASFLHRGVDAFFNA